MTSYSTLLQIHYRSEDFLEVFGKENVVYLLAESTNVLNGKYLLRTYVAVQQNLFKRLGTSSLQ